MKSILVVAVVVFAFVQAAGWRSAPRSDGRIVGGRPANIKNYPYQVSLEMNQKHYCGGSILDARTILTAANCTDKINVTTIRVRAGTSNREFGGDLIQARTIIQNPQYQAATKDFDISLLCLNASLDFTDNEIKNITVATTEPADGTSAHLTGWGFLKENGAFSYVLEKVDLNKVNDTQCNANYNGTITARMSCYGATGRGFCNGDIGGPLVVDGKQVGIASWARGCARNGFPGVFTRLTQETVAKFITDNRSKCTPATP